MDCVIFQRYDGHTYVKKEWYSPYDLYKPFGLDISNMCHVLSGRWV